MREGLDFFLKVMIGVVILFLLGRCSYAYDFEVVQLRQVDITYKSYFDGGHDPLITQNLPNRKLDKGLELNLDTDLFSGLGYWDNLVHSTTDRLIEGQGGQFRLVGYQTRLGINVTEFLQVGIGHHSQHLLDTSYQHGHFPVSDYAEVKLILFKRK